MDIATYHSTNTPNRNEAWVGYILMPRDGRQLTIRFSGPDEQTVLDRAHRFYEAHVVKHVESPSRPVEPESDSIEFDTTGSGPGRGQHSAGKTWLLNRTTGERARVSNREVPGYLARGFIKAGPRSK